MMVIFLKEEIISDPEVMKLVAVAKAAHAYRAALHAVHTCPIGDEWADMRHRLDRAQEAGVELDRELASFSFEDES